MNYLDILLIGISLSMDAFAVTVTNGMVYKKINFTKAIMMPVFFGLFQGFMPFLGFFTGNLFSNVIQKISGPLTLVILGIIGGKMIKDGLFPDEEENNETNNSLTYKTLFLQAIATSIDAFAVGITFCALIANNTMQMSIYTACSVIAITTFILSLVAVVIGKKVGTLLENKAQILGGVILVLLGIKAMF